MTSDEISLKLVEKEQAILSASEALNTVQEEQYEIKKKLVELAEGVRKGKYNLTKLRSEKEILERQYWLTRNG